MTEELSATFVVLRLPNGTPLINVRPMKIRDIRRAISPGFLKARPDAASGNVFVTTYQTKGMAARP
jgi:hypothetical protein